MLVFEEAEKRIQEVGGISTHNDVFHLILGGMLLHQTGGGPPVPSEGEPGHPGHDGEGERGEEGGDGEEMQGFGETIPYVDEKLIIVPCFAFFANSLHTENKDVTLISKYFENFSNGKSNKLFPLLELISLSSNA